MDKFLAVITWFSNLADMRHVRRAQGWWFACALSVAGLTSCSLAPDEVLAPGPSPGQEAVTRYVTARSLPPDFLDTAAQAALAATTKYLEVSDQITASGGADPQAMRTLVTDTWWPEEEAAFAYYSDHGLRTLGETTVSDLVVQTAYERVDGEYEIGVIGCVDSTGVFVLPEDAAEPPDEVMRWHPHYEDFEGAAEESAIIEEFLSLEGLSWGSRHAVVFWFEGPRLSDLALDSSQQWWGVYSC